MSDSWLEHLGLDPHVLKGGSNYGSEADVYKDTAGNLWAVSKDGVVGDWLEYIGR